MVLLRQVSTLLYVDIGILEALLIEILLGKYLCTVDNIRMYLRAAEQTELLLHVLTLTFLKTDIVDC